MSKAKRSSKVVAPVDTAVLLRRARDDMFAARVALEKMEQATTNLRLAADKAKASWAERRRLAQAN